VFGVLTDQDHKERQAQILKHEWFDWRACINRKLGCSRRPGQHGNNRPSRRRFVLVRRRLRGGANARKTPEATIQVTIACSEIRPACKQLDL